MCLYIMGLGVLGWETLLMCNHHYCIHLLCACRIHAQNSSSFWISTDWGTMWEFRPQLCVDILWPCLHLLYYHPDVKESLAGVAPHLCAKEFSLTYDWPISISG